MSSSSDFLAHASTHETALYTPLKGTRYTTGKHLFVGKEYILRMAVRKQLNVLVDADLRDALADLAEKEGKKFGEFIEDILRREVARHRGEVIEAQALPAIHDLLENTVHKAMAQLRAEIRHDLEQEVVEEVKRLIRQSDSRLAPLIVRGDRDSGIVRRLLFTLIAKTVDEDFAQEAYADAKEQETKELSARVIIKEDREPRS